MRTIPSANDDNHVTRARATIQMYARIAGVLFLLSIIAGGFGEAYVPSKLIASTDATATVENLRRFELLFRLGFAGYLVEASCDITLALIFYVLLRPVSRNIALLTALFGVLSTALFAVAELFYFAPSLILGGADYLKSFTTDQLNTFVLISLKLYGLGGAIFTAFYGIGWVLRGYLIFRSSYLPKVLGILMTIGGFGFIARNFLLVLAPAYASGMLLVLLFPGGLALTFWLLVKGVDASKWEAKVAAPESTR